MRVRVGGASPLAVAAMEVAAKAIRRQFEETPVPNHLFYHNQVHTAGVIERATKIAQAMGLSNELVALTQIAASFHDIVQDFVEIEKSDGSVIRQRCVGANERESVAWAIEFMVDRDIKSPRTHSIVAEAIMATVPAWNVQHGTAFQPALNSGSHMVTRALALADLGSAGMDPLLFASDSLTLFAEENIDIARVLTQSMRSSDLDNETQPTYRKSTYHGRLVTWLKGQSDFVRGREALLPSELNGLDTKQKTKVTALFTGFEESIARAEDAVFNFENMKFVDLARALVPGAFPLESV